MHVDVHTAASRDMAIRIYATASGGSNFFNVLDLLTILLHDDNTAAPSRPPYCDGQIAVCPRHVVSPGIIRLVGVEPRIIVESEARPLKALSDGLRYANESDLHI